MRERVKKKGFMARAIVAWFFLNLAMGITLAGCVYFLNQWLANWYVILPILIALIVTEFYITDETIAPIVKDWINQEEYVETDSTRK